MVALLSLALLMSQAATSVCGAQCAQHSSGIHPSHQGPAMAHCHAVPQSSGASVQTCPAAASFCATDLLMNGQEKTASQQLVQAGSLIGPAQPGSTIASVSQVFLSIRSSLGSPPLITTLRV
jgi:hypothetical protein